MKKLLKIAALALCPLTLPIWAHLLPASATSTDSLFFNLNAGDPGSYAPGPPTPTVWTDLAGDRDGTIVGNVTYDGDNKALDFPGSADSYVDMGTGFNDFGQGITIEFEGHFGGANQDWERIFDFGNGAESDNIWIGVLGDYPAYLYGPLIDLPNRLAVEVWRDDLSPKFKPGLCYTTDEVLTTNRFDTWAITLDGATCRMYKNGAEVNVTRWTADTFVATDDPGLGVAYPFLPREVSRTKNYVGKSNWSADPAFDGAIRYVRIYRKALSGTEVQNNYNTYRLTYASTGAESGTAPGYLDGNGLITLDGNTGNMVKAGHAFLGWATTQGATVPITGSYNLTANTTLYPVWIPVPSAPRISVSRASSTSLSVAITAPAINAASVSGYQVETSTDGATWTVASDNVAAGSTSHTITGLTTGTAYYVRVTAKYSGLLSAYGYNWQPIYEVTSPKRNNGAIVYADGFGLGDNDAAATASNNFTRVRYRMTATYGGDNNYVDADFRRTLGTKTTYSETFDSLANLRVPTTSSGDPAIADPNHFEIHANVSDLNVESNVDGVQNGSGFDGRLEIWPWNYDIAPAAGFTARTSNPDTYDDSDAPILTKDGQSVGFRSEYGSFQLHRLSGTKQSIFAWNRHLDQNYQEIGFGQYTGTHTDWTFAAEDAPYQSQTRTNFNLKVFVDQPVTPTANSYTISYGVGAGGTGSAPVSPTSVSENSTFTVPANTYSRPGYTFAGWSDGVATYAAGTTYPASGSVSGNVTLTATWTANTLTVTTDEHGGDPINDVSTTTGGEIDSPGTPTRDGYTFNGWFLASSGGTAITFPYTHGQTSDFTLHAQWTAVAYTITYNTHDGSAVADGSYTIGSTITLPSAPTRDGYTFNGWFLASSGGTALGATYQPPTTGNITLHAQWTANTLTVTTNEQGGNDLSNVSTTTGGSIDSPGTPTRDGYTFAGWFTSSSGGTAITFPHTHGHTTDFTLYAQWTQVSQETPEPPQPEPPTNEITSPNSPNETPDQNSSVTSDATSTSNDDKSQSNIANKKRATDSSSDLPITGEQVLAKLLVALMAIVGGAMLLWRHRVVN